MLWHSTQSLWPASVLWLYLDKAKTSTKPMNRVNMNLDRRLIRSSIHLVPHVAASQKNPFPSRNNGLSQSGSPAIPPHRDRKLCVPPFREVCLFPNSVKCSFHAKTLKKTHCYQTLSSCRITNRKHCNKQHVCA